MVFLAYKGFTEHIEFGWVYWNFYGSWIINLTIYIIRQTLKQKKVNIILLFNSLKNVQEKYRVGIKGSWFVNDELISWPHEPKIRTTSIFQESFFPGYKFKIISAVDICLSICLESNEWNWTMKEKNPVKF